MKQAKHWTPSNVVYLTFPNFDFETFLMRLVVAMSRAGLSNCDLAHRTGLSDGTIARILSYRSKNMFVGTVARVAKVLRISVDYLVGNRGATSTREKDNEQEVQHNFVQRRKKMRSVI